jgi:hypothetical protein
MTTATATRSRVEFKVDAMLMYGWVADAERRVTHVSNSLRHWIHANKNMAPKAFELLERIGNAEAPKVELEEFLRALLEPEESETAKLVSDYTTRLEAIIDSRSPKDRSEPETKGQYSVLLQYYAPVGDAQPLAGVRFVRDSATLLASRWNSQRVDIVIVAIAEQEDGWWKVRGFQGQLQEAWLRVKNRIVDGNRAAGIALMARNMSHNIGSHALYWVASNSKPEEKTFLRYLQARMELLAGFATKIPLSPVTAKLDKVIARFNGTSLLLNNICKSEHVEKVTVTLEGYHGDVIFFGGEAGIQAFYSILENCIRDSAKHAPRDEKNLDALSMNVLATEADDFIQLDVYDDSHNYEKNGPELRRMVEELRLAKESGALNPSNWGVKERFICAAILRGLRPEDFPLQESAAPGAPQLGTYRKDHHRVLELVEVDDNCSWRFYLPRRREAEVLLVTDRRPEKLAPDVVVQKTTAFAAAANTTAGVVEPFVVLDQLPPSFDTKGLKGALPYRTFVRGDLDLPQKFLHIDEPLESISSTVLLQKSIAALQRDDVRLIIGINPGERGNQLKFSDDPNAPFLIIDDAKVDATIDELHKLNPDQRFVIYKRHPSDLQRTLQTRRPEKDYGIEHFEIYGIDGYLNAAVLNLRDDVERGALRLLEAALMKVLIVDERLDLDLTNERERALLRLRGITLRGREFAGLSTRSVSISLDEVQGWVQKFHAIVLHRGVAEKLHTGGDMKALIGALEEHGALLAIHSGRMGGGELPPRTRLMPLANVATWIHDTYSKLQIVDELFSLRGV